MVMNAGEDCTFFIKKLDILKEKAGTYCSVPAFLYTHWVYPRFFYV